MMLPERLPCQGSALPTASPAPEAVHHLVSSPRYAAILVGGEVSLDLVLVPLVKEIVT
jgi:hypothetical protein